MQKCFYHTTSDATSVCMGCKMPICQTCQAEGKKGFCESCLKKVAALGERITDQKKTGMIAGSHKATMIKSSSRPTGLKNVTYCFHHFDVVASGTCPTCTRPFCPSCLNESGVCSHCAAYEEEPQEPVRPAERPRPETPRPPRRAPKRQQGGKKMLLAVGAGLLAIFVLFALFRHPAKAPARGAEPGALTPDERSEIQAPDGTSGRFGAGEGSKRSVLGHGQ